MRWKRIIIYISISLLLGHVNQYLKIFNINYDVKSIIDGCVIFTLIMFLLSMFDYYYSGYWYPKNKWKVIKQKLEKN